ncbi:hypothetical protein ACOSP7_012614 [Xanthoceras sorbifolium]
MDLLILRPHQFKNKPKNAKFLIQKPNPFAPILQTVAAEETTNLTITNHPFKAANPSTAAAATATTTTRTTTETLTSPHKHTQNKRKLRPPKLYLKRKFLGGLHYGQK